MPTDNQDHMTEQNKDQENEIEKEKLKNLNREMEILDQELQKLGDETVLQQERMQLLHRYNDVKDATQILIGQLAEINSKTIKALHEEYELPLND